MHFWSNIRISLLFFSGDDYHHPFEQPTSDKINNGLKKCRFCSLGPDDVPKRILRQSPMLVEAFCHLITYSQYVLYVPKVWKHTHARMLPNLNKVASLASNYRWMARTPVVCRLCRKILVISIYSHFNAHGVLPSGFPLWILHLQPTGQNHPGQSDPSRYPKGFRRHLA